MDKGSMLPGARWSSDRGREGKRDGWMERGRGGEAKVYSCGHGTAVQSAPTCDKTAVTPSGAALEKSHGFFQIFDLARVWTAVK